MSRVSKLSPNDVAQIRLRHAIYMANCPRILAIEFGVSVQYIWKITGNQPNANSPARRATQEDHPQHLGKGL